MPEGGELRSTWSAPGNPVRRSRPPRPAESPSRTGHGGATVRDLRGPAGVPRPPRTTRPGRERASQRPGPRDYPTRGHSRRAEAVFTREDCASKRADWTRGAGQLRAAKTCAPLHCRHRSASPRRWPPQAPAPPWSDGPIFRRCEEGERVRRGAASLNLKGNRQARFCGRD